MENKNIHKLCQSFRVNTLKLTQEELGKLSNTSIGTISAFETGRSTNINHMLKYIKAATPEQREIFFTLLKVTMREL